MNWLEISLTLNGELAEAVADVLARHAHQGVAIESTQIESNPDDEGRPVGPVRVCAYLPAHDPVALEELRNRIEQDLFYLGMIQPLPAPAYTPVADADWAELWKANYHPIRIGRRLVIVPAWLSDSYNPQTVDGDDPDDTQQLDIIPLIMDPGMAFGTGTHPTTQLCLALLETYLQPNDAVFDVGCGSGILSVAAAKLGAGDVLGVDIDPEAKRATEENAALNSVSHKVQFRPGSFEAANQNGLPVTYQVVLVNILAKVIINLLGQGLAKTVAPGGVILFSGILDHQAPNVITAIQAAGLTVIEQRTIGDWVAIAARQP
jgi:ribosomal protein L11 methyltransferase